MGKIKEYITTELLIIGAGIAGLAAAIEGVKTQNVFLVHKGVQNISSTSLAQGGIAAALPKGDRPEFHQRDTLYAGAGLCNVAAVKVLVHDGIAAVTDLLQMGVFFDRTEHGISFTKEAAHSKSRILHSGDATGQEIERGLRHYLTTHDNNKLTIRPNSMCYSLIVENNICLGATFIDRSNNKQFVVYAKNVVLATGGYVQVYKYNTNPDGICGDGVALAYNAGAVVKDMEFVQFHPTTFHRSNRYGSPMFLISEAVRGEGAVLRNILHNRFMPDYHPLAELAPRDIVTRAILNEMHKTNADHVLLDLRGMGINVKDRFPTIYRRCREMKINILKEMIPVVPAAHYAMGGVNTNVFGQTSVAHLYACGETAATGVHGANRLASNSLLEGLVFGRRVARHSLKNKKHNKKNTNHLFEQKINLQINEKSRTSIQEIMWQNVGIIRTGESLALALKKLESLQSVENDLETQHLLTCAILTTKGAMQRTESRGVHYRLDYPKRAHLFWKKHIRFKK